MNKDKNFYRLIDSARRGNYEEVRNLMKREYIDRRYDGDGWTVLHYASMSGSGDIVRYLLSEGCNIEDEDWGKYRPIHWAAWRGNKDALISLIEGQCCLDCVTEDGDTPLKLAIEEGHTECQRILEDAMATDIEHFQMYSLSKIMDPRTGKTLLDKLLASKDQGIVEAIKSKPLSEQEINDLISLKLQRVGAHSYRLLHECLLYRCIRHEYSRGFEKLCTPDIVNGENHFMDQSILEIVATTGISLWVNHVLRRLVSVDESWTKAQYIARTKGFLNVVKMIASRIDHLRRRSRRGYSRLHIAVHDDAPDMIEYLLEKGLVNANEGDKTIGTALNYAYYLDHVDCIDSLQNMEVNTNTVDWLNRTPLHVAISSGIDGVQSKYLVEKMENIEAEDYRGLRVLDRSILHDCHNICEQLLQKDVKLNKFIKTDFQLIDYGSYLKMDPHLPLTTQETIYTLCLKQNRTIYPCLLESIDKGMINGTDSDKNSLLHLSASLLMAETCSTLIEKTANVNLKNVKKNTPLLELLEHNTGDNVKEIEDKVIDTVTVLIVAGASCNIVNLVGNRVIETATLYDSEKLLVAIIENVKIINFMNNNLWRSWINNKYFCLIKKLISRAGKSLGQYITIDDIKDNVVDVDMSLVKALYDMAVEYVQESTIECILYKAAQNNDIDTFREMINKPIYEKSCLNDGESLLNYLIRERKKNFIDLIISSKNIPILIEKKNLRNQLPLHVCIETEYWKIIDVVIANSSSVNEEDNDGGTAISMLLSKISTSDDNNLVNRLLAWVKLLILKSGDIDYENKHQRIVIEYCTKSELKSDIQEYSRKHKRIAPPIVPVTAPTATTGEFVAPMRQRAAAAVPQICEICDDEPRNCALNCGHLFGMECAKKEIRCYVCRKPITDRRFIYNN